MSQATGVQCADGSVNLHECERDVLDYLEAGLDSVERGYVYVKAKFIDLDEYTITRRGKALARLSRAESVSLEIEQWTNDRPTTWLVKGC